MARNVQKLNLDYIRLKFAFPTTTKGTLRRRHNFFLTSLFRLGLAHRA